MALIYFDSSAFVKMLVSEDGSDLATELWDGCDAAFSSRLAYPEVRAALAAAARNRSLTVYELEEAEDAWESYWKETWPVELSRSVERDAGQLARAHALRGADAVHLASARALLDHDLIVASWDHRLQAGAGALDFRVVPAGT